MLTIDNKRRAESYRFAESGRSDSLSYYTANSLNQYTSRDVPAYLNVLGIAHANATVTVNGQSPYRRGEYFWQELSANNLQEQTSIGFENDRKLTAPGPDPRFPILLNGYRDPYTVKAPSDFSPPRCPSSTCH